MSINTTNSATPIKMNIRMILAHSQEIECAICLDIIDNDSKSITDCNHVFHDSCLDRIINNRCPLCRSALVSDNEFAEQMFARVTSASQQDLNQHMATLREQIAQLHNDWQASRNQMIQDHTDMLDRLNQSHEDARQRLDEQYFARRMRINNQSELDQAAELDQLRRDHLEYRHETNVIQMDRRHWVELECLDQDYIEHMDTFQEQIDFLLEQLSNMVEMQTAGRNRVLRREFVL